MEDEKRIIEIVSILEKDMLILTEKWSGQTACKFNQANTYILDLKTDEEKYKVLGEFLKFMNEETVSLAKKYSELKLRYRTKSINSTEVKIDKYCKKEGKGKFPVNKCLNDLFGVRLYTKKRISTEDIIDLLKASGKNIKCINSTKNEYIATHIYIKKDNNSFQWELQIWSETDYVKNQNSHSKYKQAYTNWEQQIKEEEKKI